MLIPTSLQASSGIGLNGLYEMLYTPPIKIAFVGEMQSTITEALAEVTGIWKVIQVHILMVASQVAP